MAETLTTYDPAEDLGSEEAMAVFMAEALQTSDAAYIAHALGVVARAKGMKQIAEQTQGEPALADMLGGKVESEQRSLLEGVVEREGLTFEVTDVPIPAPSNPSCGNPIPPWISK